MDELNKAHQSSLTGAPNEPPAADVTGGVNSNQNGRRLRIALFDAALALVVTAVIYPWASQFPGGLIRDDGFFYSQIAYNLAVHGSSSFDLVNSTDGYHQLWALILAGVSTLLLPITAAKSVHLFAYLAVNLYLIILTIRVLALRGVAAIALFLLLLSCSLMMEGHLALLLCVIALRGLEQSRDRATLSMLFALALLPFCRIDASIVGLFLIAAAIASRRRRVSIAMTAALFAGIVFHFSYMRLVHGSFFTVSSELKAGNKHGIFEQFLANLGHGAATAGSAIPINPNFAILVLLGLASVWLWAISPSLRGRKELAALWLGVLAFTAAHAFLNVLRPWYFTLGYGVFGYTVLAGIMTLKPGRRRPILTAVTAVMILPTALLGYIGIQQRSEAHDVRTFIRSLDANVPAGAPIFAKDGSGYLGWSANRTVINGDGLVNSHSYAERLNNGELGNYLSEAGIRYFVTDTVPADAPILIDIGGLVVRNDEAELIATKPGGKRYHYTQFLLWELKQ